MSAVRNKATAALFAGGITTVVAAVSQAASVGAGTPAPGDLALVLAAFAVVAQGVSGLISNLAAGKLAERENRRLAERNHLVRIGMAQALRAALDEQQTELEADPLGPKVKPFFKIWLGRLDLALDPKSDPAIVEGLFPLHLSESQWEAVTRYEVDEERLKKLPAEARQRYVDTQETDAAALAALLCDFLEFPSNNAPSALRKLWRIVIAAPESITFTSRETESWDRQEALAFARRLLPLYRRAFAKVFASGGPAQDAIGFKHLTLNIAKLDEILAKLDGIHGSLNQGFGDLKAGLNKGFSRMESLLGAIGPVGGSGPRVIPNYVFRLVPLQPAPVGRDAEILALRDRWLAGERDLLVWGTPGIGKSTIARAVLRDPEVKKHFGERRYELRCDTVSTTSDIIMTACEEWFGVKDSDGRRAREFLRSSLAAAPCAVLIDNFETLMKNPSAADESQEWLSSVAAIDGLWLIAGVMGFDEPRGIRWARFEPGPLPMGAARTLFNQASDYAHANDPKLDGLLEEMAGIPHAVLLLAGAALGHPSLADVEAVWRRYGTAILKGHGSLSRAETIEAAYEFAIRCLNPSALPALRVLACLPAGVAKDELDVILPNGDLSAGVLKRAALALWDGDRLKMLSPVRRHVADLRKAGKEEARPALVHFLTAASAAENLGGADDARILGALLNDQPNAAWAVQTALDGSDPAAIGAAAGLGSFSARTGRGRQESIELLQRALNWAPDLGEGLGEARCRKQLGNLNRALYQYEEARAQYTAALPLYRAAQDKRGEAGCLLGLGAIARLQNQYEEARAQYTAALPLYRAAQDKSGEAWCLWGLGEIAYLQDEYEEARAQYTAALPLYRAAQDKRGEAGCLWGLGEIARLQNQDEEARAQYTAALPLFRAAQDKSGEAWCLWGLGEIARLQNQYEEARAQYTAALPLFRAAQDKSGEAWCLWGLGEIARLQNQYEEARAQYTAALPLFRAAQDKSGEAWCLWGLGEIARLQNQYEEARAQYTAALPLFRAAQDKSGEAWTLEKLGNIHFALGEAEDARNQWVTALNLFTTVRDEASALRVQRKLAS